jgi:hypothetical protein
VGGDGELEARRAAACERIDVPVCERQRHNRVGLVEGQIIDLPPQVPLRARNARNFLDEVHSSKEFYEARQWTWVRLERGTPVHGARAGISTRLSPNHGGIADNEKVYSAACRGPKRVVGGKGRYLKLPLVVGCQFPEVKQPATNHGDCAKSGVKFVIFESTRRLHSFVDGIVAGLEDEARFNETAIEHTTYKPCCLHVVDELLPKQATRDGELLD